MISTREDPAASEVPLRRPTLSESECEGVLQISPKGKYIDASMPDAAYANFLRLVMPSGRRNVFIKISVAKLLKVIDALPSTKICLDLIANK